MCALASAGICWPGIVKAGVWRPRWRSALAGPHPSWNTGIEKMLKAVLIDSSALARGLLNTVLTDGGYDVCGQAHTGAAGIALLIKHQPHLVCIAREQVEDGSELVPQIRKNWPKTLIFMVSGGIDAAALQGAHA